MKAREEGSKGSRSGALQADNREVSHTFEGCGHTERVKASQAGMSDLCTACTAVLWERLAPVLGLTEGQPDWAARVKAERDERCAKARRF